MPPVAPPPRAATEPAPEPEAELDAEVEDRTAREPRVDLSSGRTDDATVVAPGAAAAAASRHAPTGSVRAIASLPRQRGLGGDVRYVATAVFGVARSKRELARVEGELTAAAARRRKRLIELAAQVLADDEVRHRGVAEARERLAELEDERARQAGQGAAADTEAAAARRDHADDLKRLNADIVAIEAELAEIATRLAPLERDAAAARKKALEVQNTLARIGAKIDSTKASLVSVKGPRGDRAAVEAELATLNADRTAVQRDEPKIAAELDALLPRIAELESRRGAARTRLDQARADLTSTAELLQERLGVVGAHQKVIERALATTQTARDHALAELGETLAIDRPRALARDLADLDELEVAIATDERRVMELREVLGSVDRKAVARGVAVLVVITVVIAAFALWIVTR
jgi:DNA repair exonuclease SbcCD ATPase subunit